MMYVVVAIGSSHVGMNGNMASSPVINVVRQQVIRQIHDVLHLLPPAVVAAGLIAHLKRELLDLAEAGNHAAFFSFVK